MKRNNKRHKCQAKVKNGGRTGQPCTRWAVEGAKFCAKHKGLKVGRPLITGRQSRYKNETLGESINKFRNDPDIKCIRDEIAVLRALLENAMKRIEDSASAIALTPALEELCNNIGKQVERLVKIEDGLKLTVSVVDIHVMVNQVVEILSQEVDDERTLDKIKKRLQGLSYPAL